MADKVGTKTGEKTKAGRDVYKTPEGENVSEKSVTIKFGENAYVNAPSIHNGVQYSEDEIKQMLLDGKIKPTSRHDTLEEALEAAQARSATLMKEGGMARQMDLFDEGGLMQEGGTVDPVSGNDVPIGSTQEEVRDDIPAQLSEGEFVMPADVVRYHGLDKMMALRDEAKIGLARMEAMGQMGNSEEATIPDGIPFNMDDLDIEDDNEGPMEMQVGGYVPNQPAYGQQPYQQQQQQQPYQQQPYGVYQPQIAGGFSVPSQFANYAQTVQPASQFQPFGQPQYTQPGQGGYLPSFYNVPTGTGTEPGYTFGQLMPTIGGVSETREYRNEAGQSLYIPFINGEPVYPIPEGYTEYVPEDIAPAEPDQPGTTQPTDGGDRGGDEDVLSDTTAVQTAKAMTTLGFAPATEVDHAQAFGGHKVFGIQNPELRSATFNQAKYQLASIMPTSSIASALATEFGFMDASYNDMAIAGNLGKKAGLSVMGMTNASQLNTSEQATLVGNVMSAAHSARKKGLDVAKAIEDAIARPENQAAIRAGAQSAMKDLGFNPAEVNNPAAVEAAAAMYGDIARNLDKDIADATKAGTVTSRDPKTRAKVGVKAGSGFLMSDAALAKVNALKEQQNRAIAKAKAIAVQDPKAAAAVAVGNIERGDAVRGTPTAGDVARAKDAAAAATSANVGGYGNYGGYEDDDPGTPGPGTGPSGPSGIGVDETGPDWGDSNTGNESSSDSSPGMGNTGNDTSGEDSTGGNTGPGSGNDGSDNDGPGSDDGPGTYICTASYANGIIPRDHFTSLKKYGIMLRRNDPYLMKAYDWFGPKLAAKVKDTGWTAALANLATAYYKARYTNTLSTKQKIYDKVTQTFVWPTLRLMGWVLTKVNK